MVGAIPMRNPACWAIEGVAPSTTSTKTARTVTWGFLTFISTFQKLDLKGFYSIWCDP